jgi:co-chaperonin GroES (HSP10)
MIATPHPWLIAVQPSPDDPHEEQRDSGLVIKHEHDHADECANKLKRGVVMAVGTKVNSDESGFDLDIGDVIFYHQGDRIRGLDYVWPSYQNVVATEKDHA